MARPTPATRDAYRWFCPITTRWHDNDIYGHVNNVTYYSYFDTVANTYLIERGGLDIHTGDTVGFVVNSGCNYFAPIAFPDRLDGGLRDCRRHGPGGRLRGGGGRRRVLHGLASEQRAHDVAETAGGGGEYFCRVNRQGGDRSSKPTDTLRHCLRVVSARCRGICINSRLPENGAGCAWLQGSGCQGGQRRSRWRRPGNGRRGRPRRLDPTSFRRRRPGRAVDPGRRALRFRANLHAEGGIQAADGALFLGRGHGGAFLVGMAGIYGSGSGPSTPTGGARARQTGRNVDPARRRAVRFALRSRATAPASRPPGCSCQPSPTQQARRVLSGSPRTG